jgi:UDP-glucose-4-epimerase GalE
VKVLVTGGAGYIGAHVVRALASAGHRPVILDDLRRSQEDRAGGFALERVAIENTTAVSRVFERHRPDGVVHLAGYISVAESVRDPEAYWAANLSGAASLLVAATKFPPRSFVFSSTAAVYGNAEVSPIPESAPQKPTSPYGASKLAFERLLHDAARAMGFRSAALRYFNASGAHPDWHVGEEHDPEEHLIPRVIAALLDGRPVEVNGNDYSTPDGTCVRDYVHVTDLAEAHVQVLEATRMPSGLSANCGSGTGHSVLQVIEAVGAALKIRPTLAVKARRPGDPASLVADPTTLFSHVTWRPAHSDLKEIVASAVGWELWRRAHRAGR